VVVLAGRRHEALASVAEPGAERGAELPGMLNPAPTDVTGEASVWALFDRTLQRHGRERGQGGRHQGGDRALGPMISRRDEPSRV
jgi:hypothetical protein